MWHIVIEAILLYIANTPLSTSIPVVIAAAVVVSLIATYLTNEFYTYPELAANNEVVGIKFSYFGGIFAVSLGLALIGAYSLYISVREISSNEVSALRSLYYSATENQNSASADGRQIMKQATVNYAQSVIADEWTGQAQGKMNERTTQHLVDLYEAFIKYGDSNLVNDSQLNWLGEVVKMRGLRTTTSTRTIAQMVWIILVAGALLSMLVPLFIGAQNFFVQALMSILFSAFIMLHLLAIVHLAHPFTGDIAVTASMYVDFIEETQRLGSTPLNP